MHDYATRLATEASFVGATLIPFVVLAESKIQSKALSVFVAGACYHLVSEFSGLNAWYLQHGAATLHKVQQVYEEAQPVVRRNTHQLI